MIVVVGRCVSYHEFIADEVQEALPRRHDAFRVVVPEALGAPAISGPYLVPQLFPRVAQGHGGAAAEAVTCVATHPR